MGAIRRWSLVAVGAAVLAAPLFLTGCSGEAGSGSPSPPASASPSSSSASPATPSPSSSASVAPVDVAGSLVVVRKEPGRHWAMWHITPATATEARLGELDFEPSRATASPDGARVAYQPQPWRKKLALRLAVLDVAGTRVETVSVDDAVVGRITGLTWLSSTRLLVSGPPPGERGAGDAVTDVLAVVDVTTGATTPFRGLQGADPDAAPAAGKLVYVTAEKASDGGDDFDGPAVRETLMLTGITTGGAGREIAEGLGPDPDLTAAHRVMASPCLSPDGRFVLTAETGSDITVTYTLRRVADGATVLAKLAPGQPCSAWSPDGRVAFWGEDVKRAEPVLRVWAYDTAGATMVRSRPLRGVQWVSALSWSANGDLAIGAIAGATDDWHSVVLVATGGVLRELQELTAGSLPVWVP
jgi:hypothetical protein